MTNELISRNVVFAEIKNFLSRRVDQKLSETSINYLLSIIDTIPTAKVVENEKDVIDRAQLLKDIDAAFMKTDPQSEEQIGILKCRRIIALSAPAIITTSS